MKYLLSLFLLLFSYTFSSAQVTCNGNWGPFLVNQTFGAGNVTNNWYGPLATFAPGTTTSTIFVGAAGPTGALTDGQSGLAKTPFVAGQGTNWIDKPDHTGDPFGLMFLVNAPSTAATVFFEYTMDNLCPNTTLRLGVWVLNVNSGPVQSSLCANYQYPNLTLRVVDPVTNAVLSSTPTGNVPLDSAWHQYFSVFNNGSNTSVKLQIVNNSVGSGCGNDLALDDITVQPCIPVSQVLPKVDTLVCSYSTLNFNANVINSPYSPAEYLWQYSNDGGVTWVNAAPASANTGFAFNTSTYPLGQYLIRYITGSTGTTGNVNCISISDTSIIQVDSLKRKYLEETICSGQSYDFFGRILTTGGIYDTIVPNTGALCDTIVQLTLTLAQSPIKIQMLDSIVACQYDTVALESNTLPYGENYSYQWTPNTNLSNDTDANVWFFADQSRRYILTTTNTVNGVACTLKDTIDLIVNPGDFLQIAQSEFELCPNDSAQINAMGATTYQWTPTKYLNDANIANPVAKPLTSVLYQLVGTSAKGCRDTQLVNVIVHPAAVLELPDVIDIYPGETYHMQPGTNATYFHWFPNSGMSNVNLANPDIYPTVDTRYFVTAKTDKGCAITDSVDVRVKASVVDLPNAFDPNVAPFKPVIRGLATLDYFEIYNRWGQKVFESKDINQAWDGTLNGKAQNAGVYVYQISGKTIEGKAFKQSGSVTLIR